MTQLLATATRITIVLATLTDHVFHNHFFDNPERCILDAGLTGYCVFFVRLSFSCKKQVDTGITFKAFFSFLLKKKHKFVWKYFQMK